MRNLSAVSLAVAIITLVPAASAETPAKVDSLSWLAGCWREDGPKRTVEEQWLAPRGGTMLGMSRTVAGGKTVAYEHTRIEEKDGTLVFTASPSGQPTASFTHAELGASMVVFTNPAHDFPQRVIYKLAADGSLIGRVEGKENGQEKGFDFPMTRVNCDERRK